MLRKRRDGLAALVGERHDPYLVLLAALDAAREDRGLRGVLIKLDGLAIGLGCVSSYARASPQCASGNRWWRTDGCRRCRVLDRLGGERHLRRGNPVDQRLRRLFVFAQTRKIGVGIDVAAWAPARLPLTFTRNYEPRGAQMLDAYLDSAFALFLSQLERAAA
jgi:hypothetical protein